MVIGFYLVSSDGVHGDYVEHPEETENVSETEGILGASHRLFQLLHSVSVATITQMRRKLLTTVTNTVPRIDWTRLPP